MKLTRRTFMSKLPFALAAIVAIVKGWRQMRPREHLSENSVAGWYSPGWYPCGRRMEVYLSERGCITDMRMDRSDEKCSTASWLANASECMGKCEVRYEA